MKNTSTNVTGLVLVAMLTIAAGCGTEVVLRAFGLLPPPSDPATTQSIPSFEVTDADPGVAYERFIAIGDMGTGRADQLEVAAAMVDRASRDGLDFILTLGDNIYENGVTSELDPQWATEFEEPYGDPALGGSALSAARHWHASHWKNATQNPLPGGLQRYVTITKGGH